MRNSAKTGKGGCRKGQLVHGFQHDCNVCILRMMKHLPSLAKCPLVALNETHVQMYARNCLHLTDLLWAVVVKSRIKNMPRSTVVNNLLRIRVPAYRYTPCQTSSNLSFSDAASRLRRKYCDMQISTFIVGFAGVRFVSCNSHSLTIHQISPRYTSVYPWFPKLPAHSSPRRAPPPPSE